jgi:hypothetical protein
MSHNPGPQLACSSTTLDHVAQPRTAIGLQQYNLGPCCTTQDHSWPAAVPQVSFLSAVSQGEDIPKCGLTSHSAELRRDSDASPGTVTLRLALGVRLRPPDQAEHTAARPAPAAPATSGCWWLPQHSGCWWLPQHTRSAYKLAHSKG